MKIYEKPMAIIETIEVEDVITASLEQVSINANEKAALIGDSGAEYAVVFQW